MDNEEKLKRRIRGLEKTLQIVTGHSGRTEQHLRQLFDVSSNTIPVPLLITSKDGDILFSNGKAQEIFGYSPSEFFGICVSELYENPHDRSVFLQRLEQEGDVKNFAVRMKDVRGTVFPVSLFSRQIFFEEKNCILTVIHDLSEIRREEEKRLALERQLRQTRKMEAIGTLAGGITHDFNNIMSIILGKSELALQLIPEDNMAGQHILDVLKALDRAKAIVRQILDFCREKEEMFRPFRITSLISETGKMLRTVGPKNIELRVRTDSENAIIMGDPTQIHQVIMNLCTNAVYALQKQGGIIEIFLEKIFCGPDDIMIPALPPGEYVRLTVRDNGPGIEKDILERVFDPFFTTRAAGEGSGMGLAIVHGIIQRHNGAVYAESEVGKGTAFHCCIPLLAEKEREEELPAAPPRIIGGSESILLVDDEEDITEICQQNLESLGYRVTTRSDSGEALELFRENSACYNLLITDDTMPGMNGREMVSEMRKIRPDIPVILITGKGTDIHADEGIRTVLLKPFTREEIAAVIREVFENGGEVG